MSRLIPFMLVICCLQLDVLAQAAQKPQTLESGKPVEREIAGGESHTYQITLESGQFIRVLVEQKGIDLTLALATPQGEAGKATAEVNLILPRKGLRI